MFVLMHVCNMQQNKHYKQYVQEWHIVKNVASITNNVL